MSGPSESENSRYSGILTPKDKENLQTINWGDQDSGDRDARHRVRQRVLEGLNDLRLLNQHLYRDDRRQIFDEFLSSGNGIYHAYAFVYLGILDGFPERDADEQIDLLEDILQRSIEIGDAQRGLVSDVSIDVDISRRNTDPKSVLDTIFEGNGTLSHLNYLIQQDEDIRLLERILDSGETVVLDAGDEDMSITPEEAQQILDEVEESQ